MHSVYSIAPINRAAENVTFDENKLTIEETNYKQTFILFLCSLLKQNGLLRIS